jgi:hypothetical protein
VSATRSTPPGCDLEALEALVADRLAPERAVEVQAHARACDDCAHELDWLRTERRWMTARKNAEPALPAELWQGVEGRLAQPRGLNRVFGRLRAARPFRFVLPVLTGAAAAAAAILLLVHGRGETPVLVQEVRPATNEVSSAGLAAGLPTAAAGSGVIQELDAALVEYEEAMAVLQKDLRRAQGRLRPGQVEALERGAGRTRQLLADARAGVDPEARLRALDGCADYVRSLQTALLAADGAPR